MCKLVKKYAAIFTKPGKPVTQDIKHKIELLDPKKSKPYYRLQIMNQRKIQEVQNHLQGYLEKS